MYLHQYLSLTRRGGRRSGVSEEGQPSQAFRPLPFCLSPFLSLSLSLPISIYLYLSLSMYMYIYVYIHLHIHIYMYIHIYRYITMYIYIYMCVSPGEEAAEAAFPERASLLRLFACQPPRPVLVLSEPPKIRRGAIAKVRFSDFRGNTRQKWRFQDVEYLRDTPRPGCFLQLLVEREGGREGERERKRDRETETGQGVGVSKSARAPVATPCPRSAQREQLQTVSGLLPEIQDKNLAFAVSYAMFDLCGAIRSFLESFYGRSLTKDDKIFHN